jgi:hypothetical protein
MANGSSGLVRTARSPVYDDVDTGESRTISPSICVVRTCSGMTGPIALNTVVMENDFGDPDTVREYVEDAIAVARWVSRIWGPEPPTTYDDEIIDFLVSWFGDDVLADRTVTWTAAELAAAVPNVGNVYYETIDYAGDDADYTVTYKLTRTS